MPIKDLQHKEKPGLARAGVIRLGYKVKKCKDCKAVNLATNSKCQGCGKSNFPKRKVGNDFVEITYPSPADHFVLTDAPGVTEAIGNPKPKELRIYFPFDEIDYNFPSFHQYWVASALVCRGDGENIVYGIDPQKGDVIVRDGVALREFESSTSDGGIKFKAGSQIACPGIKHDLYKKCEHCKPNAMLIVLLRDVPRLAYYQIATTSIHNIVNLTEQMAYIKHNIGKLQGVPFILKLEPRMISVPKNGGGRMRTEKYLLSLEVDPEWMQRLQMAQSQLADPMRRVQIEASIPDDEDIIDLEPAKTISPQQPPPYSVEPPVWFPPNGGDDSDDNGNEDDAIDYSEQDKADFAAQVIKDVSWYRNVMHVFSTLEALELEWDIDNAEMLQDELANYATAQADAEAEKG